MSSCVLRSSNGSFDVLGDTCFDTCALAYVTVSMPFMIADTPNDVSNPLSTCLNKVLEVNIFLFGRENGARSTAAVVDGLPVLESTGRACR